MYYFINKPCLKLKDFVMIFGVCYFRTMMLWLNWYRPLRCCPPVTWPTSPWFSSTMLLRSIGDHKSALCGIFSYSNAWQTDIYPLQPFDLRNTCLSVCVCEHRRNSPGDREQALRVMLQVLQSCEHPAPDMFCLCGRIYKDIFLDSDCKDTKNRDNAIQWWVS